MNCQAVFSFGASAVAPRTIPSIRVLCVVLIIAAVTPLTGCRDLLVEPALEEPTALSLSIAPLETDAMDSAQQGPGAAFDAADGVRIRVLRGTQVLVDLDRPFASEGSETRLQVEVPVDGNEETLSLELTLSFQEDAVFEAVQPVLLQEGEPNEVEVVLDPVPVGVEVQDGPLVLDAIGGEAQLSGVVVFATGHPIPGLELSWTSSAPSVVEVSATGRVTALAPGEAQAIGSFEDFYGSVTVQVDQAVASVTMEPEAADLASVGETLTFAATGTDANGHPVSMEPEDFAWSSSDEQVATISNQGVATAEGEGTTTITAAADGAVGSAELRVAPPVVVDFPDPNLEAAIREAIDKPDGDILTSDLDGLTVLLAEEAGIADLTGLEFATSLVDLRLRNNEISDLTPLQELTGLWTLYLDGNSISDLSPLQGLTGLRTLRATNNSISDLTPLQGLTELSFLGVNGNEISDLTPLQGLTELSSLSLFTNEISDLTPLRELTGLRWLLLDGNSISDLTPLQGLTELRTLRLSSNEISDLTPLQGLTELTFLRAISNDISDLTPLQGLTGLSTLHLFGNSISDLTPLQGLTGLRTLRLGGNEISDLSPLQGLTGLTALAVHLNEISDLTPLQELTGLTFLLARSNSISDLTPLQELTELGSLELSNNEISDLTPLRGLAELTLLRLRNNEIPDVQPLVDNEGLGSGNEVDLRINPLSQQALCEQVPALEARGVTVEFSGACDS